MAMTKDACRVNRERMQTALDEVSKKYGLFKFQVGSCRFSESSATFKVEVSIISADGKPTGHQADDFKREAHWFGFKADDLGTEFKDFSGKTYKLRRHPSKQVTLFPTDKQRGMFE
jgi:hypothetical protein